MISEEYDFEPATNNCASQINKPLIVSIPGTSTTQGLTNTQALNNQQIENAKYDNTQNISVQPMYGGNYKNFEIKINNKKYIIQSNNYENAIYNFLKNNNKIYKKDILIEINEINNKINKINKINKNYKNNLYIIKGNKKNKINIFKKLY